MSRLSIWQRFLGNNVLCPACRAPFRLVLRDESTWLHKNCPKRLPGAPKRSGTPRRFILRRLEDVHDFTGPGVVCWGVEWPDGTAAYRWNSDLATTVIASNVGDVVKIHGHEGKTVLEWIDQKEAEDDR